jgi:hypothetical protein
MKYDHASNTANKQNVKQEILRGIPTSSSISASVTGQGYSTLHGEYEATVGQKQKKIGENPCSISVSFTKDLTRTHLPEVPW